MCGASAVVVVSGGVAVMSGDGCRSDVACSASHTHSRSGSDFIVSVIVASVLDAVYGCLSRVIRMALNALSCVTLRCVEILPGVLC